MIALTFYGSSIMDYVQIDSLLLPVKSIEDCPVQCYGCSESGHGRKKCIKPPRCGSCSALNSHFIIECDSDPYCFHCLSSLSLRSRECPRYSLEQDILHFANRNFITLGCVQRKLAYQQEKQGAATFYKAALRFRLSLQSTSINNNFRRLTSYGHLTLHLTLSVYLTGILS